MPIRRNGRNALATTFVAVLCGALIGTWPALGAEQSWHEQTGYRWAELQAADKGKPGFSLLAPSQTGVIFSNALALSSIAANRILANGSGVAVGDYDRDGFPDLFFCGLETRNALYRNLGNWKFQDVTAEAGVACDGKCSRGAVFADIDSDGFPDLLVSTLSEGVLCFINDGRSRFVDKTRSSGTTSSYGSTTMAMADVDGNGTLDLYVTNYRPNDVRDQGRISFSAVGGKPVIPAKDRNRFLIRNGQLAEYGQQDQLLLNDGKGRFREIRWDDGTFVDESGNRLSDPPLDWGLTATFRDVNGDLAPDLYVCNDYWTPDRFWINDGHGRFRAIQKLALRKTCASSMGVDFADIDRDGHLDFFVSDMLSRDLRLRKRQMLAEQPAANPIGAIDDRPQVMRNTLYWNRGDGTFAEIASYGKITASEWTWSPIFLDVDLDGYDDLLISAGHFRDVQDLDAAAQIKARQHSWTGIKDEAARQKAYTRELLEHYDFYPPLKTPIVVFRNLKNWQFEEATEQWGFHQPAVHQGFATGDLDQDGDFDVVVNCLNSNAEVYRNESLSGRVAVRLKGRTPNTQGIGSKVTLLNGVIPKQTTEIVCGGRYLSGSEPLAVFATGSVKDGMTIEVRWRGGRRSVVENAKANRIYEIDEAAAVETPTVSASERQRVGASPARVGEPGYRRIGESPSEILDPAPPTTNRKSQIANRKSDLSRPAFEDVSASISHSHQEPNYNDFERQPLLPFKLSQPGPSVAWFDLDGDGHDDLIIGSGSSGKLGCFRGDGKGAFSRIEISPPVNLPTDTSGIVGWDAGSGSRTILIGLTGYEQPVVHAGVQLAFQGNQLAKSGELALGMTSASALALGDMEGDGHLDLFVGGGVVPDAFPLGAPSKLYRHDGQSWKLDSRNCVLLENIGIVNGAVWSDLTGDGRPELVLACEWGPIRVFQERGGGLFDITGELGLSKLTGWWKGVTTGDLDGDGNLDIIAANWGLNSFYQASAGRPLTFFFGQLARPGVTDVIETELDRVAGQLAPSRHILALAPSLPFLFDHFSTHKTYSEATLAQVLDDRLPLAKRVEASTLASTLFLNRGNRFEPVLLPPEAQLAPAFSVNVADFNGDGFEDAFLSQNFFALQPETPRLDAGRGLWLEGDGTGRLSAVPATRSGIQVYGEQRGAALADFDEDGRIDLAVAQNGAATKLYQNVGAKPGLRVKLKGPPGNPNGIGAVIRLNFGGQFGPAREIHAGSGYWAQDSSTQVMPLPKKPTAIWVRWPGGKITETPLPEGKREVAIDSNGSVASLR